MWGIVGRLWKQVAVLALLIGVDLAISLPIMGATYRPFSWMSIAPADAATLYPVIQDLSFDGLKPSLMVKVTPGGRYTLQRSTNLLDVAGWTDMTAATADNSVIRLTDTNPVNSSVIRLIDTNPVSRAVFYRVRQVLGGAP